MSTGASASILLRGAPVSTPRRVSTDAIAVGVILLLNVLTFYGHYAGHYAFPWDFLGGYHAQAFGWFDMGSILQPPGWMPWSDMGFPSTMALQSGAWYLPLALLDALGVPYTVRVAVAVQCLHVAFAAVGAYALCRRLGLGFSAALLAAVAFHASATFYSNQQHPDIVRATAMVPWMLFFLHPSTILTRWGPALGGLLLSQLLVAGYPGNVVATAYGCAVWVLLSMHATPSAQRVRYAAAVAVMVVIGVLLSMVKWWPVLMSVGSVGFERWEPRPIEPAFLATLLYSYDREFLPSDVTMRSLWLPFVVLWGWVFVRPTQFASQCALALVALALVMGMIVPHFDSVMRVLPGMTASRWLISDWRPILQIGLVLGGAAGWRTCVSGAWGRTEVHVRLAAGFVAVMLMALFARRLGYIGNEQFAMVAVAIVVLSCSRLIVNVQEAGLRALPGARWVVPVTMLLLVLISGAQGLAYNRSQARAWLMPWSETSEASLYGREIQQWMDGRRDDLARRPARLLIGSAANPQGALDTRTAESYNQCWYGHTYCVLGYNNIRLSMPHKRFAEALIGPGGTEILEFSSRAQQLWAQQHDAESVPPVTPKNAEASVIGVGTADAAVEFVSYSADRVIYDVVATSDTRFTENEIWWSGWEYQYCGAGKCSEWKPASEGVASLRTWNVPAGEWRVTLRFQNPSVKVAMTLAGLGLLLALLWLLAAGHWLRLKSSN
jgi:hypothetical protein